MLKVDEVDQLRERLLAQAFLYDNPDAFASGVEAALHAVVDVSDLPATAGLSLVRTPR